MNSADNPADEMTKFNISEIMVNMAATIPNEFFESDCVQPGWDHCASIPVATYSIHRQHVAQICGETCVHNRSGDSTVEVQDPRRECYQKPGDKIHESSCSTRNKCREFDGQVHHARCHLRGIGFNLVCVTSTCFKDVDSESRAQVRKFELPLPHLCLQRDLEEKCGVGSGGKIEEVFPPWPGQSTWSPERRTHSSSLTALASLVVPVILCGTDWAGQTLETRILASTLPSILCNMV